MSEKKTEMKVCFKCRKCKTGVLKVVAKLTGVNEVKVDAEKGIVSLVGSVDPVCVGMALRKAGYCAQITSFGPSPSHSPPKKPKPNPTPTPTPTPTAPELPPACCKQCQLVAVTYVSYDDVTSAICSIL